MPQEKPEQQSAIALRYEKGKAAPEIVATGRGFIAEQIIRTAKEHGVPLREDAALAATLAGLNLGDHIPPELYRAVAEVLAFVYRLERRGQG